MYAIYTYAYLCKNIIGGLILAILSKNNILPHTVLYRRFTFFHHENIFFHIQEEIRMINYFLKMQILVEIYSLLS